ncbi:MAG TPA: hypothetical protein VM536_10840 [Chloroflexia bacterium]|nr:hypothetical protein [Chloroflexia bacterium]
MASEDYDEPFGWWGWHWQPPQPLSVVELLDAHSFDAETLALIWALLARRASVIVGAEPPLAGKTTTLTALLDFLPTGTQTLYMRGHYENFSFAEDPAADPHTSYLLANEMSDHLAIYFWGARVGRLFSLLPLGYAFGSTMHAETVGEVLDILSAPPLNVPPRLLPGLNLVINLVLLSRGGRSLRRCAAVHLVLPGDGPQGVTTHTLARWDPEADTLAHLYAEPEAAAALTAWTQTDPASFAAEHQRRSDFLRVLQASGERSIPVVRRKLAAFAAPARSDGEEAPFSE